MAEAPSAALHALQTRTDRAERRAPAIELSDVSFAYERRLVLRGITMRVPILR